MMKMTRIALLAASLVGVSMTAQAANVQAAPSPSQDPLVQHLKLSSEQVKKIDDLHQTLEDNVSKIPMTNVKDGALVAMFANPLFGAWSDRTTSRFGRRRPWILAGCVGGALAFNKADPRAFGVLVSTAGIHDAAVAHLAERARVAITA